MRVTVCESAGQRRNCELHQTTLCHAKGFSLTNNDVIKQAHVHQRQRSFKGLRQAFIGPAGLRGFALVETRQGFAWSFAGAVFGGRQILRVQGGKVLHCTQVRAHPQRDRRFLSHPIAGG